MNIKHAPTAASTPASASRTVRRSGVQTAFGLRGRALLVAIPLLIGICFLCVFADRVSKTLCFGVLPLAPPAVVTLFALVLAENTFGVALLYPLERAWAASRRSARARRSCWG